MQQMYSDIKCDITHCVCQQSLSSLDSSTPFTTEVYLRRKMLLIIAGEFELIITRDYS